MIKIVHCSDLHIDMPFTGFNSDEITSQRRQEVLESLNDIVGFCKNECVDVLLLCGDIFDGKTYLNSSMQYFCNKMHSISNTKVFIIKGNHDYFINYENLPDNVHVFENNEIEKICINELNLCVYGASFNTQYVNYQMLEGFTVEDHGKINIMLMHGELLNSGSKSEYNPIFPEHIKKSGLDYLALGHVHDKTDIKKFENTHFVYCGSPIAKGFDELSDKGFYYIKIDKDYFEYNFIETNRRKYIEMNVDVTGCLSYDEIISKIDHNDGFNIYKLILCGCLNDDFVLNTDILYDKIRHSFYFVKIVNNTDREFDIESFSDDRTLKGKFFKNIKTLYKTADDTELVDLAIKIAVLSFNNRKVDYNDFK